ncbi:hypothetical protein ARALYDRAFT_899123 [Arabidopsis lyrata subsp. lyrata]|uniref:F-box associated beta-propeller type 1 domain-containing protein n=1 Tax=Arabidopsis lyrata subsp. lyrata TaxID=81972 RepID=D7L6B1_ARALL|nr:hypothetical protein ARALYDRAFT_920439 [Arabidopsis lyrata subsp. lyrata]EFH59846.1 hypothetical protein ARALYDRAFT_899135 [Arabidopsis lyrata subsp. lyrata]EFH61948.1 hypothetical protein ARALYDRAFT_899123 [Arabidopsis lyrata subsp. lyrata]
MTIISDLPWDLVEEILSRTSIISLRAIGSYLSVRRLIVIRHFDNLGLVVWNLYLGQARWIEPKNNYHESDRYAIGYDNKKNHKVLRFFDEFDYNVKRHESTILSLILGEFLISLLTVVCYRVFKEVCP